MRIASLVGALAIAGCAPQNAKLTGGEYAAFLSASNSVTVLKDNLNYDKFRDYYGIDCREFLSASSEREIERLRLDNRIPVCRGDEREDGSIVDRDDWPPQHEVWLGNDGFIVVGDELEPWRGEAIISSEGDFQIAFHQRLPGGQDFRFVIAVDPDFQPKRCVETENGVQLEDDDGDWVANWSNDLEATGESGRLFYLNANQYHFAYEELLREQETPGYSPRPWFFPEEWRAGFAAAKFGDDRLRVRSGRMAPPANYISYENDADLLGGSGGLGIDDLFHCGFGVFTTQQQVDNCLVSLGQEVNVIADEILAEYQNLGVPGASDDGNPSFRPRVHDNSWRTYDGNSAGADAWVELQYSWIRFDDDSLLEKGGSASGDFSVLFDAEDNQTRVLVKGSFEIPRIKKDTWTTDYLPVIRYEQTGETICGVPGAELY